MKFIKGRWFPLIVATLVIAIGGGIMYLFGWRVTYQPELESSWDAVSAVAAWGGVIVAIASASASFLAVWFAIQVPQKIADRQDKIALFEKRYECFQFFEECFALYTVSLEKNASEKIIEKCYHILKIETAKDLSKEVFRRKSEQFEYTLHQMPFLFEGINENDIGTLNNALVTYLGSAVFKKEFEKEKENYVRAMQNLGKYVNTIWDAMTISNIK